MPPAIPPDRIQWLLLNHLAMSHSIDVTRWSHQIEIDGYALMEGVFSESECGTLAAELEAALENAGQDGEAIRSSHGAVYAARNVLDVFPAARRVWRRPAVVALLTSVLGPRCGLVRGLYFDKPPDRTWALPWHQDRTIAVRDNRLPSQRFIKPTRKAGVHHVEAPGDVLAAMLTLRVHLDAATPENGPLRVAPGSHRAKGELTLGDGASELVLAARGDVLAMRPLVAHCSGRSAPGTSQHRRVLHLEFAGRRELGDGYEWNEFIPLTP
jgi:hypothetical protein